MTRAASELRGGSRAQGRSRLLLALSPYHISTREAPAMLALMLGQRVVTLLPEPPDGADRDRVKDAALRAPRFFRLLDGWRWSGPLWESGVLAAGIDDNLVRSELEQVYADIRERAELSPLRPLTRGADERAADPIKALDGLANDLLRGGPDPGTNVPVTACVDRFAVAHNLVVVRGSMPSIAQRVEQLMSTRLCTIGLPFLLRSGGARLLRLRADLGAELDALRDVLHRIFDVPDSDAPAAAQQAAACARAFAIAFESWARSNAIGDDENQQRIVTGYASVTLLSLPADAALRSGVAAIRSLGSPAPLQPTPGSSHAESRLSVMLVRELDARPIA